MLRAFLLHAFFGLTRAVLTGKAVNDFRKIADALDSDVEYIRNDRQLTHLQSKGSKEFFVKFAARLSAEDREASALVTSSASLMAEATALHAAVVAFIEGADNSQKREIATQLRELSLHAKRIKEGVAKLRASGSRVKLEALCAKLNGQAEFKKLIDQASAELEAAEISGSKTHSELKRLLDISRLQFWSAVTSSSVNEVVSSLKDAVACGRFKDAAKTERELQEKLRAESDANVEARRQLIEEEKRTSLRRLEEKKMFADEKAKARAEGPGLDLIEMLALASLSMEEAAEERVFTASELFDSAKTRYAKLVKQKSRGKEYDEELGHIKDVFSRSARLGHSRAFLLLGMIAQSEGHFKQAEEYYLHCINVDSEPAAALDKLASLLVKQKRYTEAEPILREYLSLKVSDTRAWVNLASVLQNLNRLDEVVEICQRFKFIDPFLADVWHGLANAFHRAGREEDALAAYRRATESDPERKEYLVDLGAVLTRRGMFHDAVAVHVALIALDDDDPEVWSTFSNTLRELGRFDEAVEASERAVSLSPNDERFYLNLGNAYYATGQIDKAEATYLKALSLNDKYDQAMFGLSHVAFARGMHVEGLKMIDKAMKRRSNESIYMELRGDHLMKLGRLEEAEEEFRASLKLTGGRAEVFDGLAICLSLQGRSEESIEASKRSIEINPYRAYYHSHLAYTLIKLGRFDEAEAAYRKAVELDPNYSEGLKGVGCCMYRVGRFEDALAMHSRAVRASPDCTECHFEVGRTLEALGRLEEAKASFAASLALDGTFEASREGLERIERLM